MTSSMSDLWTFSSSPRPLSSPSTLRNHGNAPCLFPPLQVTSPQHLLSSPPTDPIWSECDFSSFDGVFFQNQNPAPLDLQNQNLPGATHVPCGVYGHGDTPGQNPWGPLEMALPQKQCPPVDVGLESWSSAAGDAFNAHFLPDGYYGKSLPYVFSSPTTPGPSPHYPQTDTIYSPAPQILPSFDTSTQLIPDQSFFTSPVTSEPWHLLLSQTELIQEQTDVSAGFPPQGGGPSVSSAAQVGWNQRPGGGAEGGGRRGREAHPQVKIKPGNQETDNRLLCTVCHRLFRSLPALNGHMRSHSVSTAASKKAPPTRSPVSMVMPDSVPVQSRAVSKACRSGQKTCGHRSVLYRSLMHLEKQEVAREVKGHYTPPPMLSPLRPGPGLYCSVTSRGQRRAQSVHNGQTDLVAMETSDINKPRINIGQGFQAEIPPLRNRRHAHFDSQNALWLWTPQEELEKPLNQRRVTMLQTMARSSVVPGGGASPEYGLHVLSESGGDFLLAVEKLLSTPESTNPAGLKVGRWSAAETSALVKSLQLHRKDFSRIQRAVQTKSISQCVEFYYLWKRKLSLGVPPAGLTVNLPGTQGQRSTRYHDAS